MFDKSIGVAGIYIYSYGYITIPERERERERERETEREREIIMPLFQDNSITERVNIIHPILLKEIYGGIAPSTNSSLWLVLYIIHGTLYIIHYSLYSIQYTVHFGW